MKVPVVVPLIKGGFLTKPRYSWLSRRCRIEVEFKVEGRAENDLVDELQFTYYVMMADRKTMLVGEVTHVFHPPAIREKDGFLDLAKVGTLAGAGTDGYFRATRLERLSYAKPDRPLVRLETGVGDPSHAG